MVDDGVLLHIFIEECIDAEFEDFPQGADGHRKTKGNESQA